MIKKAKDCLQEASSSELTGRCKAWDINNMKNSQFSAASTTSYSARA
jgi:hypothetical protein